MKDGLDKEKADYSRKIILWILAGYMFPPVSWLFTLYYSNVVDNFDELLALLLSPLMHAYILVNVAISIFLVRRSLKKVNLFFQKGDAESEEQAAKALAAIPVQYIVGVSFYCIAGPFTPMLGKDFLSIEETILGELMGIPLVVVFNIPFFIVVMLYTEKLGTGIPLQEKIVIFTLRNKMFFITLVTSIGGAFLMLLVSVSLKLKFGTTVSFQDYTMRIGLFFGVVVFISMVNMLLAKSQLVDPLISLNSRFSAFVKGEGDLTKRVLLHNRDEYGELSAMVNEFVENLRVMISSISNLLENMANYSESLNRLSSELNQSSSDQASSVDETTRSLDEISLSVQQVSESARSTQSSVVQSAEKISDATLEINNLSNAMNGIKEKIRMIHEIASQTNLLALNATIEAARAGSHGQGFSVVAAEVGKLADFSQNAAREIEELAMKSAVSSEQVGELFQAMEPEMHRTAQTVSSFSKTAEEQKISVDQIKTAMHHLTNISGKMSSSSSDLHVTASALDETAKKLLDLIRRFKT